ncbi:MAG: sulfatase [Bacteroidales bacterium]
MKHILTIIVISCLFLTACNQKQEPRQMNVLFIVIDDLNNTLACFGHDKVLTPNIDKLASQGIKFNQAYCNYAVCNPSRSSFLTGLRPETIGVLDNRIALNSVLGGKVTLPQLFRKNGYYTMSIGKIFHGDSQHNDPLAWDEEYKFRATELGKTGEGRNMTDGVLKWCNWLSAEGTDEDQEDGQTARKAVEFIKSKHEKPFFLAVGFAKPHDPFHAPKKYYDLYPIEDCNPPVLPDGWAPSFPHSLPEETEVFNKFSENDKREFLRSYYACTSFMDAQVGKVIDALEESGMMDHTLIVFLGDHGYHLGEHNWWNKVTVYQKGHQAPMIMIDPEAEPKGRETEAMIEFVDLYPTLAALCNLDSVPEDLQGKSFANILDHPEADFRSEVNAIINRGEMIGRTVKNSKWRYIEWADGEKGVELYDQVNDPGEYHDLAGDPEYKEVLVEMRQLIVR